MCCLALIGRACKTHGHGCTSNPEGAAQTAIEFVPIAAGPGRCFGVAFADWAPRILEVIHCSFHTTISSYGGPFRPAGGHGWRSLDQTGALHFLIRLRGFDARRRIRSLCRCVDLSALSCSSGSLGPHRIFPPLSSTLATYFPSAAGLTTVLIILISSISYRCVGCLENASHHPRDPQS